MTPLLIDERRIARLADECDLIEDERPRDATWKARHAVAYRALADACNLAAVNARATDVEEEPE